MLTMKDCIIKELGTKQVGKRKQPFALIKCPMCKEITERRVRSDSSPYCRKCSMKLAGKKIAAQYDTNGDTVSSAKYHRLYSIWRGIYRRCYDKNMTGYDMYGAKGTIMCDEWKTSYKAFKDWSIANGYKDTLVVDKDEICDKLHIWPKIYSPSTCKWKDPIENAMTNVKITEEQAKQLAILLDNKTITATEAAIQYNVKHRTILSRTRPYRLKRYKEN